VEEIINLFNIIKENESYFEDINSIVFHNLVAPKKIITNTNFWELFKSNSHTPRFNFSLDIRYNGKFINVNIEEGFISNSDEFKDKSKELMEISQILNLSVSNITSIEIAGLINGFKEILSNKNYQIEQFSFFINKESVTSKLKKEFLDSDLDFIKLYFWTSIDSLKNWIKTDDFLSLSKHLVIPNKFCINVIPGEESKELFSNFFKIYTFEKLKNIRSNKSYLVNNFNLFKSIYYSIKHETDISENAPIFPFFPKLDVNANNRDLFKDISRLIIYYLFMIFSNGISLTEKENIIYYNFSYAYEKEQIITVKDYSDEEIQIIQINAEKKLIKKEIVLNHFQSILDANFLENIGKKESRLIRQSVLKSILIPPAGDLTSIFLNVDDLVKHYKAYKSKLFDLNLKEINSIITQLELNAKKRSDEVANATSKMTWELSKSLLTMLGSAAVAVFTWYLKLTKESFELKPWIIRGVFPLISGLFAIFFLFQIIAIRRNVFTQKKIFDDFIKSIEGVTGLPLKNELKDSFDRNFSMFNFYFWIFFALTIILIIFTLVFLPIIIKIPPPLPPPST